jgi:hypothetical protein
MTKPDFTTELHSIEAGKAFIEALHHANMMFHFEDSPETIGNMVDGVWVDLFTPTESRLIRKRIAELYSMDWAMVGHECPIGYALEVMDAEAYAPTLDRLTEEYAVHIAVHKLPDVCAEELVHHALTDHQRWWLTTFMRRWDAVERANVAR